MRKRLSLGNLQLRSAQNKLLRDALFALLAISTVVAITLLV